MFRWEGQKDIGIDKLISYQIEALEENSLDFRFDEVGKYKSLIHMNLKTSDSVLTQDNDVQLYDDGAKNSRTYLRILRVQKIISMYNTTSSN